jgi:hypothetical protein
MSFRAVRRSVVLGLVVGLGIASGVRAEDPAAAPPTDAGMRAYVDPATGQLVPEPATAAAAATAAPAPQPDLAEVPAPGGGTMVVLPRSYDHEMSATVGADGTLGARCR